MSGLKTSVGEHDIIMPRKILQNKMKSQTAQFVTREPLSAPYSFRTCRERMTVGGKRAGAKHCLKRKKTARQRCNRNNTSGPGTGSRGQAGKKRGKSGKINDVIEVGKKG